MAILQATDAGLNQIKVNVNADGKTLTIETAYEKLSFSQKDIENVLSIARAESRKAKLNEAVG